MTGLHFSPAEYSEEDEAFNEALRAADEAARCKCEEPEGFTLRIEFGSISVTHTACGKSPWFMFDDWHEAIYMPPVAVQVEQITGCSSPTCNSQIQMGCDCGPEINLTLPKDKEK